MPQVLPIHVAAGGLALILGAVALTAKKGGSIHRRVGLVFVGAMVVMGTTAAILGNVVGGVMSIYFVATALTTVRPVSAWTRTLNVAALTVALGLALFAIVGGVQSVNSPLRTPNGVPLRTIGVMSFVLAAVLLLATLGDLRVMRSGALRGRQRLARHLWRMCFALFIAAGSFFSIRERVAKILPEPFTTGPMRTLPILLLFGTMFYWLWRLRGRRALPVRIGHDAGDHPETTSLAG
jgi:hypothetical protein